jgi:threonylcarbamoyladenosine tRNA methylthiotransferase CDKAL1
MSDAEKDKADLWLLNSCTVKNPSEQTFVNAINAAKSTGKKIVVAGCVPQAQHSNDNWRQLSAIGVQQIDRVVEVVEETLKGNSVQLYASRKELNGADGDHWDGKKASKRAGGADLNLPKIRKNPYIEIIPVNTGCLNQCTYCKTKHARGDLGSYPPEMIVNRVRSVLDEGVTEIWLTSEDTGAYGRDLGLRLPDLLWSIVECLQQAYDQDGKAVMLRIGMTNPPYILEDLPEIARILKHPRVYKFLHVPVQSGSDRILDAMRREYSSVDFRHVARYLMEHVPGITLATDIICGFPTETDEDHQQSVELVRDFHFPVLHISQFYPRPGTPAARMPRVPTQTVKQRSREITRLFESYQTYESMIGQLQMVWVTDEMTSSSAALPQHPDGSHASDNNQQQQASPSNDERIDNCWVGHNEFYQQVLIPKSADGSSSSSSLLGSVCKVLISHTGKHFLRGDMIEGSQQRANPTVITSNFMLKRPGKNLRTVEVTRLADSNNSLSIITAEPTAAEPVIVTNILTPKIVVTALIVAITAFITAIISNQ